MNVQQPIVVDLGKIKKKEGKELRGGQGKLLAEVAETVSQVRENLGDTVKGKKLVPVVVLYKRKEDKMGFPFMKSKWSK